MLAERNLANNPNPLFADVETDLQSRLFVKVIWQVGEPGLKDTSASSAILCFRCVPDMQIILYLYFGGLVGLFSKSAFCWFQCIMMACVCNLRYLL